MRLILKPNPVPLSALAHAVALTHSSLFLQSYCFVSINGVIQWKLLSRVRPLCPKDRTCVPCTGRRIPNHWTPPPHSPHPGLPHCRWILYQLSQLGFKTLGWLAFKKRRKDFPGWAQWLRIHLSTQGTWVSTLIPEDSTCRGAAKPRCCNDWSLCTQNLCLATKEVTATWSLCTPTKRSPGSQQLEKTCTQQRRPSRAEKKEREKLPLTCPLSTRRYAKRPRAGARVGMLPTETSPGGWNVTGSWENDPGGAPIPSGQKARECAP